MQAPRRDRLTLILAEIAMETVIHAPLIRLALSIKATLMDRLVAFTLINGNIIRHPIVCVEQAKKAGEYEKYK